jgi:hypothetical protein
MVKINETTGHEKVNQKFKVRYKGAKKQDNRGGDVHLICSQQQ